EGRELDEVMEEPFGLEIGDPLEQIPHAMSLDYADYSERKRELMDKGMKWFSKRVERWRRYDRVPEHDGEAFRLRFADGREFTLGETKLRFTRPMFHGIEFSRVGWVIGLTVERAGEKVLYTSDVNGPIIEDYADWVIEEGPEVALIDGPGTYTLGYMLNRINLRRAVENLKRIVREARCNLILLDHHLPREPRFKERLREVYELAEREGVRVVTVAEHHGKVPVVLSSG
ncbi:MAG: MBL fold metallo-hydrolase, partial [Candidatus Korarchaeota archaeon]|nr:MBL fold metallo-hydrolase [Candidatus Korarchaeota archaeon]